MDLAVCGGLRYGCVLVAALCAACSRGQAPDDAPAPAPEPVAVKTAAQALDGAHVPTLDPATLNGAEIRKVIGAGRHCTFRYTSSGRPVLAAGLKPDGSAGAGVVKLNGSLVPLQPVASAAGAGDLVLAADPVRLTVQRTAQAPGATQGQRVEAEMVFEVDRRLEVGYGGYVQCTPQTPAAAAKQ